MELLFGVVSYRIVLAFMVGTLEKKVRGRWSKRSPHKKWEGGARQIKFIQLRRNQYKNFAFAFLSREISDTFRWKDIVLRSYIEIVPRRICKTFEFLCDTLPVWERARESEGKYADQTMIFALPPRCTITKAPIIIIIIIIITSCRQDEFIVQLFLPPPISKP